MLSRSATGVEGLDIWYSGKGLQHTGENRTKEILVPIIQKHVATGSQIFSDGWGVCSTLNSLGYQHFTVTHKSTFKRTYRYFDTGELQKKKKKKVHINNTECAWKHAKTPLCAKVWNDAFPV